MMASWRDSDGSSAYMHLCSTPAVFACTASHIKVEGSPSPPPLAETPTTEPSRPQSIQTVVNPSAAAPSKPLLDPKDPEGYLRKCSGYNKRTGKRCEKVFGKGTLNTRNGFNRNPEFLPTCHSHKGQQFYAGRCQYSDPTGEFCGRLFKWIKPYFQLCNEHMGHPATPCYIMKLPLELRREIYRYLIPVGPIGSSTVPQHQQDPLPPPTYNAFPHSIATPAGPMPYGAPPPLPPPPAHVMLAPSPLGLQRRSFMPLLLTNHQITAEVLDLLYGTIPFTIDIRKDGTFMCGRRLLEAKPAEGAPFHQPMTAAADDSLEKFLKAFRFGSVKNYNVDILVENRQQTGPIIGASRRRQPWWSEEVELYDLRDYVSVAVSGILSKATNLSRLIVRVGVSGFNWSEDDLLTKLQTVVEPFMRLRKVAQPKLVEVYDAQNNNNYSWIMPLSNTASSLYSIPKLYTHKLLLEHGSSELKQAFTDYKKTWERTISQTTPPPPRPPIRAMFSELKSFYTKLHQFIPDIYRSGQHSFLHRARVAREKEDILAFREVRNELIGYWNQYLEEEEQKKDDMNQTMCRMLDVDSYPSEETEKERSASPEESGSPDYLEILQAADDNPILSAQRCNVRQLRRQLLIQRQMMFRMQQQQQAAAHQARMAQTSQAAMVSEVGPGLWPSSPQHGTASSSAAGGSCSMSKIQSSSSSSSLKSATTCNQTEDHIEAFSPLGSPDATLFTLSCAGSNQLFQPLAQHRPQMPSQPLSSLQHAAMQAAHRQIPQQMQQYPASPQHIQHIQMHQQIIQQQAMAQQLSMATGNQAQVQHDPARGLQGLLDRAPPKVHPAHHNMLGKRKAETVEVKSEDEGDGMQGSMKRQQLTDLSDSDDDILIGNAKGKGRAEFIEIDD